MKNTVKYSDPQMDIEEKVVIQFDFKTSFYLN